MPDHWLSLSASVCERRKAVVSEYLLAQGASGLTESHPGLLFDDDDGPTLVGDPGEWTPPPPPSPDSRVTITGWFADDGQADRLHAGLSTVLASVGEDSSVELEVVPDQDWNEAWKRRFEPIEITDDVWIVPSWCEPPEAARGRLQLRLDPGMAFGTGTHPTTASCVTLIRAALARRPGIVLDVGTGTGILAIAALHLGATRAVGVDPDRNAVAASTENAELNGVGDRFEVLTGSVGQAPEGRYDLVVGNLLAPLLIRLAPELVERVAPGGAMILSGMLNRQVVDVAEVFAGLGFSAAQEVCTEDWAAVLFRRST